MEAVLSLDVEEAFDLVRWSSLFKVLSKFGFQESIVLLFQDLYDRTSARIKINGCLSDRFLLQWGTRHGCPASPLLFTLLIEPLAQWIRKTENIKGIDEANIEHKLPLFADDMLLHLAPPTQKIPTLMRMLEEYGTFSGYKLNIQKTQVIALNCNLPSHIKEKITILTTDLWLRK